MQYLYVIINIIFFIVTIQYAGCILFLEEEALFPEYRSVYEYITDYIQKEFEAVKLMHSGERGTVSLLKHIVSGTLYVYRAFSGSAEVYRKLIGIDCPNLPRIYEAAEKDGHAVVLEQFIQGDNIHEMLKGSLFDRSETRAVVSDICCALSVLHSLNAVHRDIKPDNVILTSRGAVLIDFDASRIYKTGSSADTNVLGTMGFAAPEQYGIGQTDPRADIYALGTLMNVMLTGKHPSTELAPGRFGRIIKKCTMVNPDDRYKDIVSLLEAL